jgi:chromosome segregation ATPase
MMVDEKRILKALDRLREDFKEGFREVREDVKRLRADMSQYRVKQAKTEGRLDRVEDCTDANTATLNKHGDRIDNHESRLTTLETAGEYNEEDRQRLRKEQEEIWAKLWEIAKVVFPLGFFIKEFVESVADKL